MRSSTLRHPALVAGASLLRLQSDERLAELAIAGHEAAFDAIVDRYRAALQRYCAGIVGPSRAEDATQQALINAHDALKRTDEVRHLRSWLYRIAHNVSLNVLRAVRDDVPLEDADRAAAMGAVGVSDGPAESFERSERFREMVAALQELPERQRAALVLRELEGRSHEEIADALGVTKGSARQHLMRARVTLRGAVTAITPYPLIARLSEMLSGAGSAGWVEGVAGAGAGATIAKLTAGIAATGALVGGAVGTERVISGGRDGDGGGTPAAKVAQAAAKAAPTAVVNAAAPVVSTGSAAGAGDDGHSAAATGDRTERKRSSAGKGRGSSSGDQARDEGSSSTSRGEGRDGDAADDAPGRRGGGASGDSGQRGSSHASRGQRKSSSKSKRAKKRGASSHGKTKSSNSGKGKQKAAEKQAAKDETVAGSGSTGSGSSGGGGGSTAQGGKTKATSTPAAQDTATTPETIGATTTTAPSTSGTATAPEAEAGAGAE